jgi:uncharacterized lipoprotein YmbA
MTRHSYLLAASLLAACASSPPSHFYTLSGAPAPTTQAAGPSITVGPVAIPAVVDRPEIVVAMGDNEVWIDEFNRWAAPLGDGIALATSENLAGMLAAPRVTTLTLASGAADYAVTIEVQRFDSAPGAYALLDAVYTVRRNADGRTAGGRTTDRQVPADKSYEALAAAHSRAIARLAGDIRRALDGLAAQPARSSPSPAR